MERRHIIDKEDWMLDWDYEKNKTQPSEITVGSSIRVFWKCHVCGGGWDTVVKERRGCPYCNNFKALQGYNDLATLYPNLAEQWDYEKNGDMIPSDLTVGSKKKVWWKCDKGHSWDAYVSCRTNGQGCPYCRNKRILVGYNDLMTVNPELAEEWDYEKNGDLTPYMVGAGSNKKVWWRCKEGHSWKIQVGNRSRGNNCPICANRIIVKTYNDFATEHPELLCEWDYEKNSKLPSEYACFTSEKVWWVCKRGHSFRAAIGDRSKGNGCAKCSEERRVSFPEKAILYYLSNHVEGVLANYREENLAPYELDIYIPKYKLAIEYDGVYGHSDENGVARDKRKNKVCLINGISLIRIREFGCPETKDTSIDYMLGEKNDIADAVYYLLDYIKAEYDPTIIYDKDEVNITEDSGEIYSLIEFSEKENSIVHKAPEIAKMWHPTKNGRINPEYVSIGSLRKFWWLGDCGHEWSSSVQYEVSSGKCPYCTGKRVLLGFNDLASTNPSLSKEWDNEKNNGISPFTVTAGSGKKVWWKCSLNHSWKASIVSRNRGNGCPICANRVAVEGFNDITTIPELLNSWNFKRNDSISPTEISIGSQTKFWWKCPECSFEWKASVAKRFSGSGCPECRKKVRSKNMQKTLVETRGSLAEVCPELLDEWDYENNNISPTEIISGYTKKVSWKCRICNKQWSATVISRRAGHGCPYCADVERAKKRQDKLLNRKQPITVTHPQMMMDWDHGNNGSLVPEKLTAGSGKRVNWKCHKCGYEWSSVICERSRYSGKCPKCKWE